MSRLKKWNRKRYGGLQITQMEMEEYVFYVNVGTDMDSVMKGLAAGSGGVQKNGLI